MTKPAVEEQWVRAVATDMTGRMFEIGGTVHTLNEREAGDLALYFGRAAIKAYEVRLVATDEAVVETVAQAMYAERVHLGRLPLHSIWPELARAAIKTYEKAIRT